MLFRENSSSVGWRNNGGNNGGTTAEQWRNNGGTTAEQRRNNGGTTAERRRSDGRTTARCENAECDGGLASWEGHECLDRSAGGPNFGDSSSGHAPVVNIYAGINFSRNLERLRIHDWSVSRGALPIVWSTNVLIRTFMSFPLRQRRLAEQWPLIRAQTRSTILDP